MSGINGGSSNGGAARNGRLRRLERGGRANMIPAGLRDLAGERCVLRRDIEGALVSLYRSRGYEEIMTPALEYYDLFTACDNTIALESAYKLVDSDGAILVLRPDMTVPASRLVATRLHGAALPLRLFYNAAVYRREPGQGARGEQTQSGAELVGAGGVKADAEILLLAAEALKRAGAEDFKIEIGHAGIFRSLASLIDLDEAEYELMRLNIEKKNYAALRAQMEGCGAQSPEGKAAAEVIARLPGMFGGREALEKAEGLIKDRDSAEILSYISCLMGICESVGFGGHFAVDLGLVQHMEYYTGIVFRGYMDGAGAPILSGGRYDRLYERFTGAEGENVSIPAAGFAVMADTLADALEKKGAKTQRISERVMIHYDAEHAGRAALMADRLGRGGAAAMLSCFDTVAETVEAARQGGIKRVVVIDEAGDREVIV